MTKTELDNEKVRVSDLQAELENARNEANDALTEAQANTSALQAALNEAEDKLENKSDVAEIDLATERENLAAERARSDKLEAELKKERKQSAAKIAELEDKVCSLRRYVLCVNTLPYHPFVSLCILLGCYIVS